MKLSRQFSVILLLVLSAWFLSAKSENTPFVILGKKSVELEVSKNDKLELAEIKIKNTSDQPIRLSWLCTSNTLNKQWDYSMCAYGKCQVGIPKSGSLNEIKPGKVGFVAIHVLPKNHAGYGKVSFTLKDSQNSGFSENISFSVKVN